MLQNSVLDQPSIASGPRVVVSWFRQVPMDAACPCSGARLRAQLRHDPSNPSQTCRNGQYQFKHANARQYGYQYHAKDDDGQSADQKRPPVLPKGLVPRTVHSLAMCSRQDGIFWNRAWGVPVIQSVQNSRYSPAFLRQLSYALLSRTLDPQVLRPRDREDKAVKCLLHRCCLFPQASHSTHDEGLIHEPSKQHDNNRRLAEPDSLDTEIKKDQSRCRPRESQANGLHYLRAPIEKPLGDKPV